MPRALILLVVLLASALAAPIAAAAPPAHDARWEDDWWGRDALEPGASLTRTMVLRNDADEPLAFEPVARGASPTDLDVAFSPAKLTLAPGEEGMIDVTVRALADARKGWHGFEVVFADARLDPLPWPDGGRYPTMWIHVGGSAFDGGSAVTGPTTRLSPRQWDVVAMDGRADALFWIQQFGPDGTGASSVANGYDVSWQLPPGWSVGPASWSASGSVGEPLGVTFVAEEGAQDGVGRLELRGRDGSRLAADLSFVARDEPQPPVKLDAPQEPLRLNASGGVAFDLRIANPGTVRQEVRVEVGPAEGLAFRFHWGATLAPEGVERTVALFADQRVTLRVEIERTQAPVPEAPWRVPVRLVHGDGTETVTFVEVRKSPEHDAAAPPTPTPTAPPTPTPSPTPTPTLNLTPFVPPPTLDPGAVPPPPPDDAPLVEAAVVVGAAGVATVGLAALGVAQAERR